MHFLASFTLFTIPSAKSAALGTVEGNCLVAGVKGLITLPGGRLLHIMTMYT
jgi:hypothetical protein